jgi:Holliday junction resolvasome RuvABC ATP-dependent DNA helicase subunit
MITEAAYAKACAIRADMIDGNEYTRQDVKEALDRQEIEDDGFDSIRTQALRILLNAFDHGTDA